MWPPGTNISALLLAPPTNHNAHCASILAARSLANALCWLLEQKQMARVLLTPHLTSDEQLQRLLLMLLLLL